MHNISEQAKSTLSRSSTRTISFERTRCWSPSQRRTSSSNWVQVTPVSYTYTGPFRTNGAYVSTTFLSLSSMCASDPGYSPAILLSRTVLHTATHPLLIGCMDHFLMNPLPVFVLDLAPNGEMQSRISRLGSLSLASSRYYAAQIVDALEYMHGKDVIHRCATPSPFPEPCLTSLQRPQTRKPSFRCPVSNKDY